MKKVWKLLENDMVWGAICFWFGVAIAALCFAILATF